MYHINIYKLNSIKNINHFNIITFSIKVDTIDKYNKHVILINHEGYNICTLDFKLNKLLIIRDWYIKEEIKICFSKK